MATGRITDDDVELYALDRLADERALLVEEHLLVCMECRERLAEWDAYVGAMRTALEA
jgi:anti-sigma factor RsiW